MAGAEGLHQLNLAQWRDTRSFVRFRQHDMPACGMRNGSSEEASSYSGGDVIWSDSTAGMRK